MKRFYQKRNKVLEQLTKIFKFQSNLDKFPFPVRILRSNRKSISLIIKEGSLLVRCPIFTRESTILRVIKKKKNWIILNIEVQRNNSQNLKKYCDERIYLFLGEKKKLELRQEDLYLIKVTEKKIIFCGPDISERNIKVKIVNWYKKIALDLIKKQTMIFSKKMSLKLNKIQIKDYRSKWGLCMSGKKEIFINWRLIMSPISVLNYVVIHELCHLIEPNHSKNFWFQVHKYKPNYKDDKKWLSKNGYLLFF